MLEPRLRRYQLGDEGAGVAEVLVRDDLAVAEGEYMSPPELEAAAGRLHARRVVADDDHLIAARDELPRLEPRDVEQVGEELEELRDLREAAPCAGERQLRRPRRLPCDLVVARGQDRLDIAAAERLVAAADDLEVAIFGGRRRERFAHRHL